MDAARFITSVSSDIPWHVTAFHRDYKMTDAENTSAETLIRAAEIGQEAGLNYVYAGNLPGRIDPYEHTFCPQCGTRLIERLGYLILDYQIRDDGRCPKCETQIAGVWPESASDVRLHSPSDLFFRGPRRV
jgi:pyruvate formate lyase activating enzyme